MQVFISSKVAHERPSKETPEALLEGRTEPRKNWRRNWRRNQELSQLVGRLPRLRETESESNGGSKLLSILLGTGFIAVAEARLAARSGSRVHG